MSVTLTPEEFKRCLPKQMHNRINIDVVDKVNQVLSDPDTAEMMRDNIIGYTDVLKEGRFKITSYIDAVRYVSYKLMGNTNMVAFVKTFPDKYNDYVKRGVSKKDIASYVTAYNKNKLVNLILEQSLVPTYVLNAANYQEAINTQMEIMRDNSVSPKVRSDAANSILNHLKRPEPAKVELDVGIKESDTLTELKNLQRQIAAQQADLVNNGTSTSKEIAETRIFDGECTEVTDGN